MKRRSPSQTSNMLINQTKKQCKAGKRVSIMQEKQSISDVLNRLQMNMELGKENTYTKTIQPIIESLEIIMSMDLKEPDIYEEIIGDAEEGETLYQKIHMIASYFQEMNQNPELWYEEPVMEEFDGQEVIWPTTLALWLDDIEKIVDEVKGYLLSTNKITDIA